MSEFICNIRCTSSQNIDFIDTICLWPFIHDWHYSVPPVPAWPSALCLAFPVLTGLRRPKQTWLQWPGTWPPGVSGSWPLLEMATASSTVWSPPWTLSPPAALVWTWTLLNPRCFSRLTNAENYFIKMSPSNSYTLFRGLRSYLLDKKYDQQFGDLVPQILCNSFQTELKIINEEPSGDFDLISNTPWSGEGGHIYLHRHGLHYNGIICAGSTSRPYAGTSDNGPVAINPASYSIPGASHHLAVSPNTVPECDATVQSHSGSSVSNRRHSYSRRDLLDIRSSNPTPILRHVRKALFQSFLWSPQTPSPAGIDSSSPRDCDADLVPHPPVGRREPGLGSPSQQRHTKPDSLIICPNPVMIHEDTPIFLIGLLTQSSQSSDIVVPNPSVDLL